MSAWPGSLRFGGSDRERGKGRPRPGRDCSAEEDAAAADRRRRLEAFLAQKGRPRPAGGRPYLKDRTNGQALAPSRPSSMARTERRKASPGQHKEATVKKVVPRAPHPTATTKHPTARSRFPQEPPLRSKKAPTQSHPEKPLRNDHSQRRQKAKDGKENAGVGVTTVWPTQKRAISGPVFGNQGSSCNTFKQPALLGGRGALSVRSNSALPLKEHQTPRCPSALPGKRPPTDPRPTPARSHSAATRSGAQRKQGSFRQRPRTPNPKHRPTTSAGHTAPACGGLQSSRRRTSKPRQPDVGPGQELKTPSAQDRRKLLEDWLVSRGKRYKRPPMRPTVPKPPKAKSSLNLSFWGPLEEEEEKKKKEEEERKEQQYLANKFVHTLAECQKLAEEGLPAEQILATLTRIPQVEKFAQFWVCKATLEARKGTLDVTGLYEAALSAGATPLQELQDAIAGILKHVSVPSRASPVPEEEEENADPLQSPPQSPSWAKPCSAIKLQVLSLPRSSKRLPRPEVRLLTPVRRSLRIEGATASYPQMLRDHDPVVSSLDEIVAAEHGSQFLFRSNAALPGVVGVSDFVAERATWGHGGTPAVNKALFPC
ncbi:cytoskeleton-associated protein 2-like [Anolis sagrei]|uniref:cytoskeleton-associated protein 2-like n=1 Tax=Anolis sagrei TaxID=38937 RepID=UPI0035204D86